MKQGCMMLFNILDKLPYLHFWNKLIFSIVIVVLKYVLRMWSLNRNYEIVNLILSTKQTRKQCWAGNLEGPRL